MVVVEGGIRQNHGCVRLRHVKAEQGKGQVGFAARAEEGDRISEGD